MRKHEDTTAAKRLYIGNAVFMVVAAWIAFRPFYVGWDLIFGLTGKRASGEAFVGGLILLCAVLMVLLTEIAVCYSFRFCKPRKSRFALWGAIPFAAVTLLRSLYAVLQSWAA